MSRENKIGGTRELNGRHRRLATSSAIAIAVGLAAFGVSANQPVFAADDQQLQMLEDQIRQLQAQIDALKKDSAKQAQMMQSAGPGAPNSTASAPSEKTAKSYMSGQAYMYGPYRAGANEFGWSSDDGANSIEITGRLHLDAADYISYHPQAGLVTAQGNNNPRGLVSGFNVRRARLGVVGQFAYDWQYGLVADFGGSSDTTNVFESGNINSLIENAFISYSGFNNPANTVPVAIDAGYIDVPVQLNEAMSSNDRLFMEAPTPEVIATEFVGGDQRSAFGARSYKTNYYAAFYATGPAAGAPHVNTSATNANQTLTTVPSGEPMAFLGRATYQPYTDDVSNLHVGVNGGYMINPGNTQTVAPGAVPGSAFGHSITLSDRPELRVDPTSLLTTGTIANVKDGMVWGAELAGQFDHFFAEGEAYDYIIERYATPAAPLAPTLNFDGAYGEASWTWGGKRAYIASTGAYSGVAPDAPLNMRTGSGWGAFEIAARYSYTDLNSNYIPGVAAGAAQPGIEGGVQQTISVGANYYPYANVKLMLDYIHTDLTRSATTAAALPNGATVDAVAARFQVAW